MKIHWNRGQIKLSTAVAIFAVLVLAAVCIFAFRGYVASSYMLKSNANAKEIFYAAQSYLTEEKAKGTLGDFNQRAKFFGKALGAGLLERILRENYHKNDVESKVEQYYERYQEGDIRYLVMESEAAASENRNDNLILRMMENQLPDEKLQQAAVLIEYNCVTGDVLHVFYSSKVEKLTYEGALRDQGNVIARSKELLTQKEQGYYGVSIDEWLEKGIYIN